MKADTIREFQRVERKDENEINVFTKGQGESKQLNKQNHKVINANRELDRLNNRDPDKNGSIFFGDEKL